MINAEGELLLFFPQNKACILTCVYSFQIAQKTKKWL